MRKGLFIHILNAAIFIAMEVAAVNMLRNGGTMQNFLIAKVCHSIMAKTWGTSQAIGSYFHLIRDNESLATENFALSQKVKAYEDKFARMKLDSLSGSFTDVGYFHYIPATIVKTSGNKQHNYLILGEGSEDGVEPHSGIVTSDGVVGIIDAVGKHYSFALSFKNTELSISARLGKEGAVGPMIWDGKSDLGAVLKDIPLQFKFEKGDTVYTSGFSSIFPPDIPLGVTGESKIVNGATYEINISLFRDPSSVRFATIVCNIGREELEELERRKEGGHAE